MNDFFAQPAPSPGMSLANAQKTHTGKWMVAIVLLVLLSVAWAVGYAISQYNQLQRHDVDVSAKWGEMVSQYTRRLDLVPNLVTVVKSYAAHETEVFSEIAAARAAIGSLHTLLKEGDATHGLGALEAAQRQLSVPLARLLLLAEQYPDLKANGLYRELMAQLEGTENRIAYARQRYIQAVADYNFAIRRFPNSLMAQHLGYEPKESLLPHDLPAVTKVPRID